MSARTWVFLTMATIAAVVSATVAVGYGLDPYGVWRDPRGRQLAIYFSERRAKYLMNKRYVPSNFDGLIVGPSSVGKWKFLTLAGVRVYNESLSGGNAAEERVVVNQALDKGKFKLAIFILSPAMTSDHELKDGLGAVHTSEAIGSIHLFVHEAASTLLAMHVRFPNSDNAPNGQALYPDYHEEFHLKPLEDSFFKIDPVALDQFSGLVQELRDRGARIIYVVPPLYEPCYELNRAGFTTYLETIRRSLPPAPVIDFDGPAYTSLRNEPDNFNDCSHTNSTGAAKFTALLEKLVPEAISSGH